MARYLHTGAVLCIPGRYCAYRGGIVHTGDVGIYTYIRRVGGAGIKEPRRFVINRRLVK
jgi:hypothetical protein